MIESITGTPVVNVLSQALRASSLRHGVISNNIANVNTPGFKKSDVLFESLLAEQIAPSGNKLAMVRTNDKHLPVVHDGLAEPVISESSNTTMRVDGNNVDIDSEMAELSKNSIYYNASVTQLAGNFSKIKSVIAGQK